MRRLIPSAIALTVAFAGGCDESYEEYLYRSARRQRTVYALSEYVRENPEHPQTEDASKLISKYYEHASAKLDAVEHAAFLPPLLAYLAEVGDPTVDIEIASPDVRALVAAESSLPEGIPMAKVSEQLGGDNLFSHGHAFADGANAAVIERLGHDVVRFDSSPDYGSENVEHPKITVKWSVRPSGNVFSRPGGTRSFPGIGVDAVLTLEIPGNPTQYVLEHNAEPSNEVEFETDAMAGMMEFYGSPSSMDDDVYAGMAKSAFHQIAAKMLVGGD